MKSELLSITRLIAKGDDNLECRLVPVKHRSTFEKGRKTGFSGGDGWKTEAIDEGSGRPFNYIRVTDACRNGRSEELE